MEKQKYYLNSAGTRMTGGDDVVLVFHGAEGYCKKRKVQEYRQLGNFSTCHLKYKGKLIGGFLEDIDGTPVLFVDYTEKYR